MKAQLRKLIPAMLALFVLNAAAVTHYVDLNSPSPTPPYTNWPTAATNIQDAVDSATAGDSIIVSNGMYQTGGRVVPGSVTNRVVLTNAVALLSLNGPQVTTIGGGVDIRCAYVGSNSILSGFTIADGQLQQFVNGLQRNGGGIWCETGGIISNCVITGNFTKWYSTMGGGLVGGMGGGIFGGTVYNSVITSNYAGLGGGVASNTLYNCLLIGNKATNNGLGGGAYQATLSNCTVVGNSAKQGGGGVFGGTVYDSVITNNSAAFGGGVASNTLYNCLLTGNKATNYNGFGGGAYEATLSNCTLVGNSADHGGGASGGTLYGCTLLSNNATYSGGGAGLSIVFNSLLVSNSATFGGGAYGGSLYNCTLLRNNATNSGGGVRDSMAYDSILYFNFAPAGSNSSGATLIRCCRIPMLAGNITNEPRFLDLAGGNLRLQSNSPCINSGNNANVTSGTDLDGNPRIAGGTVDMGAYEFQSPSSVLAYAWAQQNGLPTDGSADFTDPDSDGANNWQESQADTIPTNVLSVLRMVSATNGAPGLNVTWQSVSTRKYWLERATNLGDAPPFQAIATNIAGAAGMKTYTDTSATNEVPYFYRVGVQ